MVYNDWNMGGNQGGGWLAARPDCHGLSAGFTPQLFGLCPLAACEGARGEGKWQLGDEGIAAAAGTCETLTRREGMRGKRRPKVEALTGGGTMHGHNARHQSVRAAWHAGHCAAPAGWVAKKSW